MRRDPHDEHPAVTTARHLRATADTWPDLVRALTPAPRQPGAGRVSGTSGRPLPINVQVHDVMADISAWAYFWARALLDETDDWTPPPDPLDTPALLRALALRVGHFLEHPDPLIARAFTDEVEDVRRRAERTAHPTGARRIPVHVPCLEVSCPGAYTVLLQPDRDWRIPDLICDKDGAHRITPAEWQRLERRRPADPSAARELLARVRGA